MSAAHDNTCRLNLPEIRRGKVRDVFALPGGPEPRVLMVASDRISAFDVIMPTPIPGKGALLTEIAAFWLGLIAERGLIGTHMRSTDAGDLPDGAFGAGLTRRDELAGRVTIGRACRVLPVEFVVRGYLEGTGLKDYRATGSVCGIELPAGLRQCDRLPGPIFTPATKADTGHDENISPGQAEAIVDALAGVGTLDRLRRVSLAIYEMAAEHARQRGIIIADTKFEFGLPIGVDGEPTGEDPILIDEALTPDSSRFWPADDYEPRRAQASFDKQFLREYLQELADAGSWDKAEPGPELPTAVVEGTLARYREARDLLLA